jgi:O-antigen/teichoic acid export membrane protein
VSDAEVPGGSSNRRADGAALGSFLGAGEGAKDHLALLSGTIQNVVGLVVFVLGTFGANILVARAFGGGAAGATALGVVTLGTQFAFIAAAGTRFGMDMAAVRYVAIEQGRARGGRIGGVVNRAVAIAGLFSVAVAVATFLAAPALGGVLSDRRSAVDALRAAALALPFVALTYVYLGGSRGLKIMRHTLYVQWMGQPIAWIALMLVLWQVSKTPAMAVVAYMVSWAVSTAGGVWFWSGASRGFPKGEALARHETRELARYGAPRAPAALLSQGLFWIDWFVASAYAAKGDISDEQLGVYSSCVRVALAMVLFLTAVSYVFSPFVADLHARGERERLDRLFKAITRWTVSGTIPILLVMLIVPGAILQLYGGKAFESGTTALRILVIGQAVNVSVGAAGFVLIMAGRTGWDLAVYVVSALIDLGLALALVPILGIEGAAIAQCVTIAASNVLRLWLVRRHVEITPWDRHYLRLAIPAAIGAAAMLAIALVVRDAGWLVQLVAVGGIGSAIYFAALLAFGLAPEERVAVRTVVSKLRASA